MKEAVLHSPPNADAMCSDGAAPPVAVNGEYRSRRVAAWVDAGNSIATTQAAMSAAVTHKRWAFVTRAASRAEVSRGLGIRPIRPGRAPLRCDDQPRGVAVGPRGWILGRRAVSCDGAPCRWPSISAALPRLRVQLSAQLVASRGGMHAVGAEQRRPRGGLLRPRYDPKPAVRTCEPPKE